MARAANHFFALLLVATTVQVHGGSFVDAEDISKTIESKNGVVIDCVYIHKQPTLKHPLFKDHKIQVYKDNTARNSILSSEPDGGRTPPPVEQEWHRSGSCPVGTIPVRRLSETGVKPDVTVIPALLPRGRNTILMDGSKSPRDEFAVAYGFDWPYHGASALLPSWRPAKIEADESSITSIAIAATVNRTWIGEHRPGDVPPDTTNQIAVGLMVSKSFFGNDDPNLYVYYSSDGGKSQKCFNHLCPGFVQTSNKIALGTSFINGGASITYKGVPYVAVSIHRVPGQKQWWVSVNDTIIGYFPHTIFPTFFLESFLNQIGGAVRNSWPGGVHTDTMMGNGQMPDSGSSAVVKAYLAVAANGADKKDKPTRLGVTAPKCYNAAVLGENLDVAGYDIAYGGPGGSGCDQ